MYQTIVVTTAGEDIDHAAVRHAATLAQTVGATLILLHVLPDAHRELEPGGDLSVSAERIEQDWQAEGEHALDEGEQDAAMPVRRVHVPARGRSVPQAIVQECAALNADLIVMATHGRTGWAHLVRGSVAESVVHDTNTPVLLLHHA